jgi:hypothetical protein
MWQAYIRPESHFITLPKLYPLWSTPGPAKEHRSDQVFRDVHLTSDLNDIASLQSKGIPVAAV